MKCVFPIETCRKRALSADTFGDGCKRCNCKKSKCLKLYVLLDGYHYWLLIFAFVCTFNGRGSFLYSYCECFAAGVFCIDSCSCHDCHNTPSFEDTVLETRQQIESRNPLAFAPKIMRAVANSPMTGVKVHRLDNSFWMVLTFYGLFNIFMVNRKKQLMLLHLLQGTKKAVVARSQSA